MIGETVSHFKILEKLGEGGMGVVYKAQDLKLDRHVALKFLPSHLTENEEAKKRFIHEAKAASALDHPNICAVHEINETEDGRMFIAMASYEGETLKERLARGPLDVADATDIVSQVATGLAKAHEKDIVHRDVKPANILITDDGVVKILDFGIAKLGGRTKVTKTGTTVGTVSYMSPEQAQSRQVDHRTDVWSLGVVLYEMLTGARPFPGDHEAAVAYRIINAPPVPMEQHRTDLNDQLRSAVSGCLQKDADERFESMGELSQVLEGIDGDKNRGHSRGRRLRRAAGAALVTAIVLTIGYIGYARWSKEEIVDLRMGEEFEIVVVPFWAPDKEARATGEVMRRMVQRELEEAFAGENEVRIVLDDDADIPRNHAEARRLARVRGGHAIVWGDVLVAGDEAEIQLFLTEAANEEGAQARTASPLSVGATTPGQFDMRRITAEEIREFALLAAASFYLRHDLDRAEGFLDQVSQLTSEGARLRASLCLRRSSGPAPGHQFDEAALWCNRAIEMDSLDVDAYLLLGRVLTIEAMVSSFGEPDPDYSGAISAYRAAIAIDPKRPDGYTYLSDALSLAGRDEESKQVLHQGMAAIPADPEMICALAWSYAIDGEVDRALRMVEEALRSERGDAKRLYDMIGQIQEHARNFPEAITAYNTAARLSPYIESRQSYLFRALSVVQFPEFAQASEKTRKEALERLDETTQLMEHLLSLDWRGRRPVFFGYRSLSEHYFNTGQARKAIALWERIAELDPAEPRVFVELGNSLARAKRFDEAIDAYYVAIATDSGAEDRRQKTAASSYGAISDIYRHRGEHDEAWRILEEANDKYPDTPALVERMGDLRYLEGDFEEAARLYLAAIVPGEYRGDMPIRCFLALERSGDRDKAREFISSQLGERPEPVLARHPGTGTKRLRVYFCAGLVPEDSLLADATVDGEYESSTSRQIWAWFLAGMSRLSGFGLSSAPTRTDTTRAVEYLEQCLARSEGITRAYFSSPHWEGSADVAELAEQELRWLAEGSSPGAHRSDRVDDP